MSKLILFLCPYPKNTVPGQRLKYEQYFSYIESKGYDIHVASFFDEVAYKFLYRDGLWWLKSYFYLIGVFRRILLLRHSRRYVGVYVFLNVFPLLPGWVNLAYLSFFKQYILDVDDLVHLSVPAPPLARFFYSKGAIFDIIKQARYVITCTPTLTTLALELNLKVQEIPSTVDTSVFTVGFPRQGTLVIGWSGSHSTLPYLNLIIDYLVVVARYVDFKLLVMSTGSFHTSKLDYEFVNWTAEVEVSTLQRMDIGLYPLPDSRWVYGKSSLKAIQYMAVGVPVIASNRGHTSDVVKDGITGLLVQQETEWTDKIIHLARDPILRSRLGSAGRSRVESLYSLQSNREKYLRVLEESFISQD